MLDVEEHHRPAAPEHAERDERRNDRARPRQRSRPPRRPRRRGRQDWPVAPALARNVARSSTTRVTRPAPTSPPPSPSRRAADTVKIKRRPSTFTNVASASTTDPTATGARWSNWTRVATLACDSSRCPSVARHVASSHSASKRGVARTGTSPDRNDSAVSDSPTTSSTWALSPECGPCPAAVAAAASDERSGTTITIPP